MGFFRHNLRFLATAQLLPALESGEETTLVGGQAVLEGVMMRSPHAWGIAVQKQNGEMVTHSEPLERPSEKHAEFNAVAREYSAIQEEIEERFGRDIANLLRSDRIRSTPIDLASRVCAARIYQLEAMQKRPKEIASRLTDSILRS